MKEGGDATDNPTMDPKVENETIDIINFEEVLYDAYTRNKEENYECKKSKTSFLPTKLLMGRRII